jgi:hypothetical protein
MQKKIEESQEKAEQSKIEIIDTIKVQNLQYKRKNNDKSSSDDDLNKKKSNSSWHSENKDIDSNIKKYCAQEILEKLKEPNIAHKLENKKFQYLNCSIDIFIQNMRILLEK